jgi:hypothetical protein
MQQPPHFYHFNLSQTPLLLTSLLLLPPGNALVQSISPLSSTPNILIFCMALTNAASHAPLLTENVVKGIAVSGCCATFLSDCIVKGAFPRLVSE